MFRFIKLQNGVLVQSFLVNNSKISHERSQDLPVHSEKAEIEVILLFCTILNIAVKTCQSNFFVTNAVL